MSFTPTDSRKERKKIEALLKKDERIPKLNYICFGYCDKREDNKAKATVRYFLYRTQETVANTYLSAKVERKAIELENILKYTEDPVEFLKWSHFVWKKQDTRHTDLLNSYRDEIIGQLKLESQEKFVDLTGIDYCIWKTVSNTNLAAIYRVEIKNEGYNVGNITQKKYNDLLTRFIRVEYKTVSEDGKSYKEVSVVGYKTSLELQLSNIITGEPEPLYNDVKLKRATKKITYTPTELNNKIKEVLLNLVYAPNDITVSRVKQGINTDTQNSLIFYKCNWVGYKTIMYTYVRFPVKGTKEDIWFHPLFEQTILDSLCTPPSFKNLEYNEFQKQATVIAVSKILSTTFANSVLRFIKEDEMILEELHLMKKDDSYYKYKLELKNDKRFTSKFFCVKVDEYGVVAIEGKLYENSTELPFPTFK